MRIEATFNFLLTGGPPQDKPFVFVAVNCRLNSFGFLSSSSLPPDDLNAGLQDQKLALKVLRREAAAFGGDPEKVRKFSHAGCIVAARLLKLLSYAFI